MEYIEGLEVWEGRGQGAGWTGLLVVVISRAPTGMWTGFLGQQDVEKADAIVETLTSGQVEYADVATFATNDMEFRSRRAASKWARRVLSRVMRADQTPDGWEPGTGWVRRYNGPLTLQHFEANARQARIAEKIATIEREIADLGKVSVASLTDDEYAAHRRLKRLLKTQKSELQGGDNE